MDHRALSTTDPSPTTLDFASPYLRRILADADPDDALRAVIDSCAQVVVPAWFMLYRAEPSVDDHPTFVLNDALTPSRGPEPVDAPDLSAEFGPWLEQLGSGEPVVISARDLTDETCTSLREINCRSLLITPVVSANRLIGLIVCVGPSEPGSWSQETRSACDAAALAVATAELRDRARRADQIEAVLAYSFDTITVVDAAGSILWYSPNFARVLGTMDDRAGSNAFDELHSQDRARVRGVFADLLTEPGGQRKMDVRLRARDGSWRSFEAVGTNQIDNRLIGGVVVSAHDVTDRKRLEERLHWQALHDPLTNLANRTLLLNDLRNALARSERSGDRVGILYLDLDGFKEVNDHFGHSTGDQLLMRIGERLRATARAGETVARLGGDEFIVLLEGLADVRDAERAAERVLDAVRLPVSLNVGTLGISASIGIALARSEAVDPDELLVRADTALYAAKRAGRNRYLADEDCFGT